MIRFTLSCADGHAFDSWFQSSSAYEALRGAGRLSCAVCGSGSVEKALMAPAVSGGQEGADRSRPLTRAEPSAAEQAIAALRRKVEETSDYVGLSFATEARAMHDGLIPERPIYGEARGDEARALIADGIPVAPLPFLPRKRSN